MLGMTRATTTNIMSLGSTGIERHSIRMNQLDYVGYNPSEYDLDDLPDEVDTTRPIDPRVEIIRKLAADPNVTKRMAARTARIGEHRMNDLMDRYGIDWVYMRPLRGLRYKGNNEGPTVIKAGEKAQAGQIARRRRRGSKWGFPGRDALVQHLVYSMAPNAWLHSLYDPSAVTDDEMDDE